MEPIRQYWRESTLAHKLVSAGLFVFFVFVTINWSVAKNGLYIAVLAAIVSLFIDRRSFIKLDKYEWWLFAILFLLVIHSLLSLWVNDFPEHGYLHIRSRLSKLLLFIPIYLFVRKEKFPYWLFLAMIAAGAIVGGIDALINFVGNGLSFWRRVKGGGDSVFYYTVIMGTFTATLWSAIPYSFKHNMRTGFCLLIPLTFAVFGVVISGARGIWLALFIAMPIFFIAVRQELKIKGSLVLIGLVFMLCASLWQVDYINIRVKNTHQELMDYFSGGIKQTSAGERFELWKIASCLGIENPVFGVGPAGYATSIKQEYQERNWNQEFQIYEYPHNQFMGAFACLGAPGLILYLLILILPGWLFLKGWHDLDARSRHIALAGGMVVVVYFVSCLTYDHLMGRIQISVYAALIGVLLGMVKHRLQQLSLSGAIAKNQA